MRQDPRNPGKPVGKSAKSGFTPGASKAGKAAYRVTGDPGDALGGPQPVPAPQARPRPRPAPRPHAAASNHAPLPAPAPHPAQATGGRVQPQDAGMGDPAAQVGAMGSAYTGGGYNPGQSYAPPGINEHLLALLARALSPDTF